MDVSRYVLRNESENTSARGDGESPTNAKKAVVISCGKGSNVPGVVLRSPGVVIFEPTVPGDEWLIGDAEVDDDNDLFR